MTVITAAPVALQTHVRIKPDKDGKYRVTVEKKPASDELLGLLVQELLGFGSERPDGGRDRED